MDLSPTSWQWNFHIIFWNFHRIFSCCCPHPTKNKTHTIKLKMCKKNFSVDDNVRKDQEKRNSTELSVKRGFCLLNFTVGLCVWALPKTATNDIVGTYRERKLHHLNLECIWICMIFTISLQSRLMFILILSSCNHIYIQSSMALPREEGSWEKVVNLANGKAKNISPFSHKSSSLFPKMLLKLHSQFFGSLFHSVDWMNAE